MKIMTKKYRVWSKYKKTGLKFRPVSEGENLVGDTDKRIPGEVTNNGACAVVDQFKAQGVLNFLTRFNHSTLSGVGIVVEQLQSAVDRI